MESIKKIILPTIEVTKGTTRWELNKLSLDCCRYVFRWQLTSSNKQYETYHGKQEHVNNIRLNFSTFDERIVLNIK